MQSKWKLAGQRVGAAKRWLAKAEEEFSRERPVRGELNLLLAEAELKRLKESEPSASRRWLRHSAAVLAALMIAGAGAGVWWSWRAPVEPVLAVSQPRVALKSEFPSERPLVQTMVHPLQQVPIPEARMAPSARLEKTENPADKQPAVAPSSKPATVGITDDEVRQLVRKAGQTLRGQQ